MLSQIIRFYGHAMQGMMGSYLEKNVQAFTDIQNKFADQSKGAFEGKPLNPEIWSQFMNIQGPMMQGMMNNYIDQSKNMFVQMQEQMQNQARRCSGRSRSRRPRRIRSRKRNRRRDINAAKYRRQVPPPYTAVKYGREATTRSDAAKQRHGATPQSKPTRA